jgi:ribonuclease HI
MATNKLTLYTDGCSKHNPGPAAIGVVIKNAAGQTIATMCQTIGEATNNQAEYRAVIAGLEKALDLGANTVEVRSDSQLIVEQLNGRFRVKDAELKPLFQKVQELHWRFAGFHIDYIPRGQNQEADKLANQAFRQAKLEKRDTRLQVAIRPATTTDYAELFAVYAEIEAQHARALPHIFKIVPPETRTPHLDAILGSEDDALLVAEINGHIAGLIQVGIKEICDVPIMISRRYAKISDLAVKKVFQRRGIGTALMAEAEKWARARQASTLELNVWEFNTGAQRFYLATGYDTASRAMGKSLPLKE